MVIGGVFGDVLWRTLPGTDVFQPDVGAALGNIDALALNTDTGAVGIGDRDRNYEELRCNGEVVKAWRD